MLSDDDAEKDELEERALDLSLKYHFVTPLTSLVVVKPDGSNDTTGEKPPTVQPELEYPISSRMSVPHHQQLYPISHMMGVPGLHLGLPGPVGPSQFHPAPPPRILGQINAAPRPNNHGRIGYIMSADSDPHFLLHAPNGNITVCFNVMGKSGNIFNLIKDSKLGN